MNPTATIRKVPAAAPVTASPVPVLSPLLAAWRRIPADDRALLESALSIAEVIDTTGRPPLVAFPLGSTVIVRSAWEPSTALRVEADGRSAPSWRQLLVLGMRGIAVWHDGKPVDARKGNRHKDWPSVLPDTLPAWYGPHKAVCDALVRLKGEGWYAALVPSMADADALLDAKRAEAPTTVRRIYASGSSARTEPVAESGETVDYAAALAPQ